MHLEKQHKYNLFYAVRDGELKHISEVENGLKCGCSCAACEKKLIARNGGTKRIHHFAHYENFECKYGVQTSIHFAAKEILAKAGKIKIPSIVIFINTEIEKKDGLFISHGEFIEISSEQYIKIEEVILEKRLHKYIPDVLIINQGRKLIIEIAVTHFVGRNKLQAIVKSKISALEIDLSKIKNDFNLLDLDDLIIENNTVKNWLHNEYIVAQQAKLASKKLREIAKKNHLNWVKAEREKKDQIKRDREIWYKKYYREISYYKSEKGYKVGAVAYCPLKKDEPIGKRNALVKKDCRQCKYSRKERENGQFIVCLFDYEINRRRYKS